MIAEGQDVTRSRRYLFDMAFGATHVIGYVLFVLCMAWVIVSSFSTLTADSPLNPASVFLYWPSLLIVAGGTILFVLFIGGKALGRSLTLSFALTGLIGTLVGYYLMLQGFLSHRIEGVAMGVTFIIAACFFALLGMIILGAPLGDRTLKLSQSGRQGALSRIAWFLFPLICLIFLTVTFVLVITPIKKPM